MKRRMDLFLFATRRRHTCCLSDWSSDVCSSDLVVIVGLSRLRGAAVGVALLLFWTAYPFFQFHGRHTFHLEFLVIAGFMALLSLLARSAMSMTRDRKSVA